MVAWQQRVEPRARRRVGEQGAQRGIRKQQLAARVDDADGVFELLDRGLEVGDLTRHLRAVGRQLLADRVEEGAELAEFVVFAEVHLDAELAAPEPRQAAANQVNRTQQQLREQHRDEDRDRQGGERRPDPRPQRLVQVVADQQRRDTDANRSDLAIAEQQRLAMFEVLALARVDRAQLLERRLLEQPGEVAAGGQRLSFERAVA